MFPAWPIDRPSPLFIFECDAAAYRADDAVLDGRLLVGIGVGNEDQHLAILDLPLAVDVDRLYDVAGLAGLDRAYLRAGQYLLVAGGCSDGIVVDVVLVALGAVLHGIDLVFEDPCADTV